MADIEDKVKGRHCNDLKRLGLPSTDCSFCLQESIIDLTLTLPSRIHNSLIGPKGSLVRSVMDDCGGVRIQFPPSGSKKDDIKLHGPREDVKKAEAMLLELAEVQVGPRHDLIKAVS